MMKKRHTRLGRYWLLAGLLSGFLAMTGCSDSDDDTPDQGTPDPTSAVYLIQSAIQSPEGDRTAYLNVIGDMTDEIDASKAIELGSSSRVRTAFGKVYSFNTETLVITRYAIEDDLSVVVESDNLSMQSAGVKNYGWSHLFASETRAYYSDDGSRQFIVWDPTEMVIVKTLPYGDKLPTAAASGLPTLSADGKHIFVPFMVMDYATLATDGGARVAILSTETEELVDVLHDTRCPGGQFGNLDPNSGDYIYEGDANYGLLHHFGMPTEVAPCFLRITNGDTAFDPTWIMVGSEVNEDGYTVVSGTRVLGDRFLTFARDDNEAPVAELSNLFEYFGPGSYWRHYSGSTSDWQGKRVDGPDGSSAVGLIYPVDGSFLFSPVSFVDRTAGNPAKIYRLTDEDTWEYLTETIGFVQLVERVR